MHNESNRLPNDLTLLRPRRPEEFWNYPHDNELVRAIRRLGCGGPARVSITTGQFGCGKTSLGFYTGLWASCPSPDPTGLPCGRCEMCDIVMTGSQSWRGRLHQLDASDDDIVDRVLEAFNRSGDQTIFELGRKLNSKRPNIIFIDEAQRITPKNQDRLLTLFERPQGTRFVLATTELDKIDGGIKSRAGSAIYRLSPPTMDAVTTHVSRVIGMVGGSIDRSVALKVAEKAGASPRVTMSILQELLCISKQITQDVWQEVYPESIFDEVRANALDQLLDRG